MKSLLVIGAGGHGQVVAETAQADGYEVSFLDDHAPHAIGTIHQFENLCSKFDAFFVAIGNNQLRRELLAGFLHVSCPLATLIHPSAYISPSASIGQGTIICPMAIVNARTIVGRGCIISAGSILDHDVMVYDFAHIDVGAICSARTTVDGGVKINAGQRI